MPHEVGPIRICISLFAATLCTSALAEPEGWRPYQFEPDEHYRYTLEWVQPDGTTTGHYALAVVSAGGRLRIEVDGKLGDLQCNASSWVGSVEEIPQQMMVDCMQIAPAVALFWGPLVGYWAGRDFSDSAEWSHAQGGESLSFRIEGDCSHAGLRGKLAVMEQSDTMRLTSCVSMDAALPLSVKMTEEGGNSIEAVLVEYRR